MEGSLLETPYTYPCFSLLGNCVHSFEVWRDTEGDEMVGVILCCQSDLQC